jgi:hypothetical protein
VSQPVDVHPPQGQELTLAHPGHRRGEVERPLDPPERVVGRLLIWFKAVEVDGGRLRCPKFGGDRLPAHSLFVSEFRGAFGPLRGSCFAAAMGIDRGCDERVELCLVEEPNVLVGVGCGRFLGCPTRVFDHPAVSKGEVEDAVQEAEIVTCALDRLTMLKTGERELLDVVLGDPRDRLLAEIRA